MTSEDFQGAGLFLDAKADEYRDQEQPELAQKMRDASAACLDAAFPFHPGDTSKAAAQLRIILNWLEEFEARL